MSSHETARGDRPPGRRQGRRFPLPLSLPRLLARATLALAVLSPAACDGDPLGPDAGPFVTITEVWVRSETDFNGRLEIEAHLYDAATGRFLGCSGQGSGLRDVDYAATVYPVRAHFQTPPDGAGLLGFDAVSTLDLRLVLIEDDNMPCPTMPDFEFDDLIMTVEFFGGSLKERLVLTRDGGLVVLELLR